MLLFLWLKSLILGTFYLMKFMNWFYTVSAFFCILAFSLPNHYPPWLTVFQETSMIIAVITLAIAFLNKSIKIPKIFFLFLGIVSIPIFQYLLGISYYRQDAFVSASYLFLFWITMILGYNAVNLDKKFDVDSIANENILNNFLNVLIGVSILQVWIVLRQWLLFDGNIWTVDIPIGLRSYGNFGQPNHLATFLCMGLIATLIKFEYKLLSKYTASFIGIFLLIGVVLTQSRTAWIIALTLTIWWGLKRKKLDLRLTFKYLGLWVGSYYVLIALIRQIARFLGLSDLNMIQRFNAGYERLSMWQQVCYAIKQEPFFGYGWGQLRTALMQTVDIYPNAKNFESAHNLFLDLIIWNGLPVATVIIGFIFWILIKLYLIKVNKIAFLLLACALPIFIHSLLEYPLSYAYFLLPFGLILGMVYCVLFQTQNLSTYFINIHVKIISVCVITLVLMIFIYEYIYMNSRYQQMRYETANLKKKVNDVDDSKFYIFTDKIAEYIWLYRLDVNKPITQEDLKRVENLVLVKPDIAVLAKYIQILYKVGDTNKAKKYEKVLKNFYPPEQLKSY